MSDTRYQATAIAATEAQRPARQWRAARTSPLTVAIGLLRQWRQRQRMRRELSLMSARDFGDLAVPPSLIAEEVRRWPWQESSPQWATIDDARSASESAKFAGL